MTTHTLIAASSRPTPALDLETRLALLGVEMDARLDEAAVAFAVNTAHIASADPVTDTAEVVPLTPTATPTLYNTPIADVLHRARLRIEADGWCRDNLFDESGAICPIRAIRLEAATRREADDACVLLLDVIQQHFDPGAETIPSWNASQNSPAPVLLAFGHAAQTANAKGI
ncbi:hypothetical protein AB5J49_08000 [Streptomyces sp. R28]|uniref:Uncharacterized protein n=1 Tax=Streptomyces sp. R28 TaxID=3238628 RepID=A0AB39PWC9_9ACTN